ncbi:MAG: hypothetical protein RLZZ450_2186, partial [Pseudomonadota bacterium]
MLEKAVVAEVPRPVQPAGARIPLRAHLVWFGAHFPWLNVLA